MIEVVAETGSTNADLAGRIAAGARAPEGDWLVADRQTAGRGRQGRAWTGGHGNFMGSTVVHVQTGDLPAHRLSLVAGVAVHAAILATAPNLADLMLKWPNDVLAGAAKLAGVLLERLGDSVVVGVGVNLAKAPDIPGRATASLAGIGYRVERDAFAQALEASWNQVLESWHAGCWHQLRADWLTRAHPIGSALSVHGGDGKALSGTFAGVDADGALQLQLADGTRRTIHAGDVTLDVDR